MPHESLVERLVEIIEFLLAKLFPREADRLNLTIEGPIMSNLAIGQTATAKIAPTAAGVPATVTGVAWTVAPPGAYTIVPSADGMSAVYTAAVLGTGIVASVDATNSAGTVLTDSAALPDVGAAPGVADALNLTITTP